jgi:DNA-binding protein H-NS
MARMNGKLSEKSVTGWFSDLDFQLQADLLEALQKAHKKSRQVKINALERQLEMLRGKSKQAGTGNGHTMTADKPKRGKPRAKVKYRDPQSGGTWSGRGRMATWLAEKVKAGEKPDKYLA